MKAAHSLTRRNIMKGGLLGLVPSSAVGASNGLATRLGKGQSARAMTIARIECVTVKLPFREVPGRNMARELPHWAWTEICEVHLQSGHVGYGETLLYYTWGAPSDEAIDRAGGQNAAELMWDDSLGAGLQMALFDAVARAADVPIHCLLGRQLKNRVPLAWWNIDTSPEDMAAECKEAFDQGYRSYKTKGRPWFDVWAQADAVSQAVPDEFKLTIDFNDTLLDAERAIPILQDLAQVPEVAIYETPIPQSDIAGNQAILGIGCLLAIWIHATHVVLVLAAGLALAWQWRTRIAASFRSKPITCGVATAAVVCVTAWLGGESHQTRILLESVSSSPERLPRHLAGLADVLMGNRVYEYLSGLPPPDWIVWVRPAWYAAAALLLFLLIKFGRNPDRIMACLTIVIFCLLLLAGRMLRLHRASYERYILYLVPLSGVILVRGLTAASHWFRPFFRGPSRKCLLGEMDGDCPSSGRAQPTRTRASNELDGASPVFQGWTHLLPLGLSVILLVQFWCSYFVPLLGQTCAATLHRTFRSGLEEPKAELAAAIRKRLTQTDSVVIVAEDWWIHHAVEFLLAGRHAVHSDVEPEQAVEARFVAGFAESSFVREVRTSAVARRTLQEELHFGRSSGDPVLTLLVCEPTTEKREPQPD